MKITPLNLKEAALAWAQEKHVEVLSRSGWGRILKPGEMGTKEEANKCWTSFVFWDATHPDSLKEFRLVETLSTVALPQGCEGNVGSSKS